MARVHLQTTFINSATGLPITGGTAQVYLRDTTTNATLYTSETGSTTASNPVSLTIGYLDIWISEGSYDVLVAGTGVSSYTASIEAINAAADLSGRGGTDVISFNTRNGAVTLSKADVTGTGLAATDIGADVSGAAATAQAASLQKASNLSDLANASTARTNLGLGSAATHPSTDFDAAGLSAAETARATAAEGTNAAAITAETTRAEVAEAAAQAAAIAASAQALVPTAVKTSAYTAAAGDFVPVDISGGSVTVTLPNAPADKTRIGVKVVKVSGTPGSTTCSAARSGSDVFNVAAGSTSLTLTALFQGVLLQYSHSAAIWYVSTADSPVGTALGAAKLGSDGTVGGASGSPLSSLVATRRVTTVTQAAAPVINTDTTDVASITGLAQAITSMSTNLTGTPVDGQLLIVRITDNGTARAITWGASFEASTVALPTTTVISTMLMVGFSWNVVTSKWRCVAVA